MEMADTEKQVPAGQSDKRQARREREAQALRRNLARRKAQARNRSENDPGDHGLDEETSDN